MKQFITTLALMALIFSGIMAQEEKSVFQQPPDPDDIHWDNQFGPTALSGNGDLPVYSSAVDGNNLYLAGDFLYAGDLIVNHVVKWDGIHWSALGTGMNDRVTSLAIHNSELYAGGWFTMAGRFSSKSYRQMEWDTMVSPGRRNYGSQLVDNHECNCFYRR